MKLFKILTYVFFAGSLFLAFKLYRSVQGTIEERRAISIKEAQVIEQLKLIRESEINFRDVYGYYTSNWDSLADFVINGQVPIIEKREEIIMKDYGGEDVIIHIDTLGYIPAKDKIFKQQFRLNAPEDGIFRGFRVEQGSRVIRNQRAYGIEVGGKVLAPPFLEQGTITQLADVRNGDRISKGQEMVQYWDYRFESKTDLTKIGEIPYLPGVNFDIYVGMVDRNGVMVQVIEVKDSKPVNPNRKEDNEAKVRMPLRFGSRNDVSTSGNWE